MANRTLDLSKRTLRINLVRDQYRQSTSVGVDGVINRSRQLCRIQRAGAEIILTYFDSHSLKYIIKTISNTDDRGNPKKAFLGPVTWNAQKVQRFRGESDFLTLEAEKALRVVVEDVPQTDADWKSDVRYFGIRDALLGDVPTGGRHY